MPPSLNGIDFLEVVDGAGAAGRPQRQRLLRVALPERRRRRAAGDRRRRTCAIDGGVADQPASAVESRARRSTATCSSVPRRPPGRLLDLHAAASVEPGRTTPLAGRRPAAVARSTSRSRSTARATSTARPASRCPPEPRRRAGDRLPRQGLRQLPPADARPAGAARCRTGGAQPGRPRRRAGRAARLRGRPPQLPAGRGRDRGVPRHRAPARLGAPPRAAGRLRMHDGCNARAWVHVEVAQARHDVAGAPNGTPVLTGLDAALDRPARAVASAASARAPAPVVFETMHDAARSVAAHNEISLLHLGRPRCCLPAGATRATLRGPPARACARGDVLDLRGGARPAHRRRRRTPTRPTATPSASTAVTARPAGRRFDDPTQPTRRRPVTEISLGDADALPFPLCVSARTDDATASRYVDDVSVALGNIVLPTTGARSPGDDPLARAAGRACG